MKKESLLNLLKRLHDDDAGAVSLETILIIGAISLPILIFLVKVGWPSIKSFFIKGLEELQQGSVDVSR